MGERGRVQEQARQISQRICNRVSAARGIKYYTIFMAAHTGGLNNRQKHRRGAGEGVEADVKGVGVQAEVKCVVVGVRAVRHYVVASAGSETTNNSWPQTAACFWNCVSADCV